MKIFSLIQNHKLRTFLTVLVMCALIFANFTVLSHAAVNTSSTNVVCTISSIENVTLLLASIGVITLDDTGAENK